MHGLGVGHHREHPQVDLERAQKHRFDHVLEQVANVLLSQERGLNVNLSELRLPVSAQIFVAETLGDLVVAVKAGHHQQLLEQLRALWQREKVAIMDTAGHQVVTRALWRRLAEHRGLDVHKTMGVEKLAHLHGHPIAQHQVVLHVRAAQVQHPVGEPGGFAQVDVVQLERRCDRGVQHLELMAQHLDAAALELVIGGASRPGPHQALDLDAKLIAQHLGGGEHVGPIRVADHLHITFAVTHIHKNNATVIAAPVNPTAQSHCLAQQGFGHQTAIMGTHGHKQLSKSPAKRGTGFNRNQWGAALAAAEGGTTPMEIT